MALLHLSGELKKLLEAHPEINYEEMMIRFEKLVEEADNQETPDNTE